MTPTIHDKLDVTVIAPGQLTLRSSSGGDGGDGGGGGGGGGGGVSFRLVIPHQTWLHHLPISDLLPQFKIVSSHK